MKVVINKCYGGFGLSNKALLRLFELGSPYITLIFPQEYFANSGDWKEELEKAKALPEKSPYKRLIIDDKIVCSDYSYPYDDSKCRSCPLLVQVVEEMGEEAFGAHADLRIVEIPDGVDYEISEYDGLERVDERHRSWN